jgi:hypothetical protein
MLGDALDAVKKMSGAVDPYLPEALCRVDQIRALRKNRKFAYAIFGKAPTVPVPDCYEYPPGANGIGIEQSLRPLRAGVYVYRHPTLVALGIVSMFAVPFFIGYAMGKGSK